MLGKSSILGTAVHSVRLNLVAKSPSHQLWPSLIVATISIFCPWAVAAQPPQNVEGPPPRDPGSAPHMGDPTDCATCHYCEDPASASPCLRNPCLRHLARRTDANAAPGVILLSELEDAYLPVPFDHRGHADMADMTSGCEACHHHTPAGRDYPPCRECHTADASGTSVERPGLRGAYHQQCLSCHREWSNERACEVCHRRKTGSRVGAPLPTPNEVLGRMHPPASPPAGDLYDGMNHRDASARVIFRHGEHVDRFGLRCVECHRESGCVQCHGDGRPSNQKATLVEHHSPCIKCHRDDMNLEGRSEGRCDQCHWAEGRPQPAPFDHTLATSWPLKAYHAKLSCRTCHATIPFRAASTECTACHTAWNAETLNHAVTGQQLDDNHIDVDCEDCHAESRYDRPPVCSECHEPNIQFPDRRPGPVVEPVPAAASVPMRTAVR